MKREAINHTKMKRLCRRLDLPLWQAVGMLETLWGLTAREAPRGDIGKLSNEDIALGLDYRGDENEMVSALQLCGWLDPSDDHRILIHDWPDHADDAVQMRLARAHELFADGSAPKLGRFGGKERENLEIFYGVRTVRALVDDMRAHDDEPCARNGAIEPLIVPLPEPHQSPTGAPPEPEIPLIPLAGEFDIAPLIGNGHGNRTRRGKPSIAELEVMLGPERLPWWEKFWDEYPCKESKRDAMEAFERRVKTRELAIEMWRGAKLYRAKLTANPALSPKYAQGWINGEREKDEIVIAAPILTAKQQQRSEIIAGLEVIDRLKGRI